MVVQDLDLLFDIVDTDLKGYLTVEEVQLFDESTFFEALDLEQVSAAFQRVCGNSNGQCSRGEFHYILQELERRRTLESQVKWDFRALDTDDDGRISLQSALFLFKTVHDRSFTLQLWNSFLSSRNRPEDDVAFDEIRLFLCNVPEYDSSSAESDYLEYSSEVQENQKERDYNLHKSLISWQEDDAALVQKEKDKKIRAEKLKDGADHLIDRIDEIGLQALLEDDDGYQGRTEERPQERVNATDLLDCMKDKYDAMRDHLLLEMLKIQVGEGMWAALSSKEQNERVFQLKVEEEKLRKDGKLDLASTRLPGSKHDTGFSLLSLMDESLAEIEVREQQIKEKMKESGMEYQEVEEEFLKKLDFTEKQKLTTDQMLVELSHRLTTERETLANRLQGIGGQATMTAAERESLFAMLLLTQIRAINELSFESAALAVGISERLQHHTHDTIDKDKKRQEQLARRRLLIRKGRKMKSETSIFIPVITRSKKVAGRIDLELEFVQQLERRLTIEREVFINYLQGKDSTHHRVDARKLGSDGRANQLLVLKTQWQGWRDKNTEDKLTHMEQHRAMLQEAVALVLENRKEQLRMTSSLYDDLTVAAMLLGDLQRQQGNECKGLMTFNDKDKSDLSRMANREIRACEEQWFDNIAAVIFGIRDVSNEEEEVIKALNEKYDALRDQLLLEALKKQMSDAEWANLSEQERQARLTKLKLMERRLRKEGKYDEAAALLGDAMKHSELLQSLMGENRQRYNEKLQERLRLRKKRIHDGEEVDDDEDELIDDDDAKTSGNILKDLQLRYEQEKEALLRKLQEGEGRFESEKERQAELMRLRLEKRKAEREGNFESAALVLGLAERNQASKEEKLKKDRERQEQLARERLEARRNARNKKEKFEEDPEPEKDDITGWQDCVMKELEKRHKQERDFFVDLMKDPEIEDIRDEAKNMSEEERFERIAKLKDKREELDFEDSSDQEEHGAILEMAASVKMIIRQTALAKAQGAEKSLDDIDLDDVIVSLMADLQQIQDKETEGMVHNVQDKSQEELATLRTKQIDVRKYEELSNVAEVVFTYEGAGTDREIVKALDKKYDTLMDKLILESLQNQMGAAEWAAMSERERQAELLRRRLEQKRLMREGRLEEAARVLGEGFEVDANLKKLMGQNRARYEEMMKEKLARRRERLKQGLPVDDEDDDDELLAEFEEGAEDGKVDARALLEDMQKRYDEEKEALMSRLKGADAKFLSERERQAELARLRREQRQAQQEEKFGAAALVLGLAERNQATIDSRLKSDRARQEQLAKERLERMREKRKSKKQDVELITEGDDVKLREAVMQHLEHRHSLEREALLELLQHEDAAIVERANCMTLGNREERLKELGDKLIAMKTTVDKEEWMKILYEMTILKEMNRAKKLKGNNEEKEPSKNDITISILADLQQQQDKESEERMKTIVDLGKEQLITQQKQEIEIRKTEKWSNIVIVVSAPEDTAHANDDELVDALQSKYDTLKEKLIYEALERKMGTEEWNKLSEEEKYEKMMEIRMKIKTLQEQGKTEELQQLMAELFADDTNVQTLLGLSVEEQEKRTREKEELRRQRREEGMSEEEIEALEKEDDRKFEEEMKNRSTRNALLDLERNFEAEKDALLDGLRGTNARLLSERERQAELARLKREQRRAKKEDKFESAALVLSVAKTQQAELESKLKSDRERQEQLAKARLMARRNKRDQAKKVTEEQTTALEDTNDVNKLQEAVLTELEKKHTGERDILVEILNDNGASEWDEKAKRLDFISKQRRLDELKVQRTQWREAGPSEMAETAEEQIDIFKEAASLKLQLLLAELAEAQENGDVASIKILADLQDSQDKEASYLMKDLSNKAVMTLKQLQKVQFMARSEKWYDNVASSLLGIKRQLGGPSDTSEDALVDALDSKYGELKEKLFIEVLKKKFGEEEWNNMSRKEQQEHLDKLRAEEAKLRSGEELGDSVFDDVTMQTMDSYMEKSRYKKEQQLKKRMERKKRARELGISEEELAKQEGESLEETDVATKDVATKDMLKDLQSQYEAEKDALLASLQGSDAKLATEKERQLALIKLRREKHRIKREDKFDSAAIIFNMAKENKKQQEQSYEAERARQEQLARDRIAALRQKKKAKSGNTSDQVLQEQQLDMENDVRIADQLEREGTMAVQNVVLDEMEKKHHAEQKTLVELLSAVEADTESLAAAGYLTESQRDEKLATLRKDRDNWKDSSVQSSVALPPDSELTEEEKKASAERITENWTNHRKILTDGLVLRSEAVKQELITKGYPPEKLDEEVSVILLANLQEKQTSETNAMCTVISDKQHEFLLKVKEEQRRARRETWMDNLATTILGAPVAPSRKKSSSKRPDMNDISEEAEGMEEMLEEQENEELAALEEEMEQEKKKRQQEGLSEEEMMKFMSDLQNQQEAKRKAVQDSIERQREAAKRRIEEKRRKRDEKQYEEDLALTILSTADKNLVLKREKTTLQKSKQSSSLEDRLRQRREERKKRAEEEARTQKEEEEAEKQKEETEKAKKIMPPLPGGGLRREKTVVEEAADMDDSQKQEIVGVLMREHTSLAMKLNRDQTRQEEKVKLLRSKRRQKQEEREQEAAAILGIGERQKTIVATQAKSERERQIQQIRDRVNRIKYERTMTVKEPRDQDAVSFHQLLTEEDVSGLSEDERMARVAKKMEMKFKQEGSQRDEEQPMDDSTEDKNDEKAATTTTTGGGGKLDDKMQRQKLKDRYLQKKKSRKNKHEKADDDEDFNEQEEE